VSALVDGYVRENRIALEVFADAGHSEFNGIDGRTLHALARRGLVWFEAVDPWAKSRRYRGGVTDKGRAALALLESPSTRFYESPESDPDHQNGSPS
jgi:hypothetical protein